MPFDTSFATGDTVTSTDLNTIAGAWTAYTPTIGGTGWTLGNGTITGRWKKVGRVIVANIIVTWGTTSTFGSGPLTVTAPTTSAAFRHIGYAVCDDVSVPASYDLLAFLPASSTAIQLLTKGAAGTYVTTGTVGCTTNVPMTWASGDIVHVQMTYESST